MSDLFWLANAQKAIGKPIRPLAEGFPLSHRSRGNRHLLTISPEPSRIQDAKTRLQALCALRLTLEQEPNTQRKRCRSETTTPLILETEKSTD
jgi:hypothetical protein